MSKHAPSGRFCATPILDRLEDKYEPEPMSGCWLWTGTQVTGYGYVRYEGKMRLAHVVMYELLVGPVPPGLQLDHLCRVRPCINPRDLEPVTQTENILRGTSFAARYAKRTACKRGHPYTAATQHRTDGARVCLMCRLGWQRAHDARLKAGAAS